MLERRPAALVRLHDLHFRQRTVQGLDGPHRAARHVVGRDLRGAEDVDRGARRQTLRPVNLLHRQDNIWGKTMEMSTATKVLFKGFARRNFSSLIQALKHKKCKSNGSIQKNRINRQLKLQLPAKKKVTSKPLV